MKKLMIICAACLTALCAMAQTIDAIKVTQGKTAGKTELLGNMGTPCTNCTAVEVTDGTTTVTLYKPTNVSYIKK